jgi:hypothetical protein
VSAPFDAMHTHGDVARSLTNFKTDNESACAASKWSTLISTPSAAAITMDPSSHGATPKQQCLGWLVVDRITLANCRTSNGIAARRAKTG